MKKISYFADREAAEKGWGIFLKICFLIKICFYAGIVCMIGVLCISFDVNKNKTYEIEKIAKEALKESNLIFRIIEGLYGDDINLKNETIKILKGSNQTKAEKKELR